MPELPEVETVRKTLKQLVQGKTIRDVDIFYDKMIRCENNYFINTVSGTTILDIKRIGKYLIFDLGEHYLISHLRMEGKYFVKRLDEARNKHEHMIFYFSDGDTLRYHDTRKFGTFDLILKKDLFIDSPIVKLGPEPFDSKMNIDYLYKKIHNKTIAIKSALLDQTIIAGLGNIYVNEVLFYAKISPTTPSNEITKKQCETLIEGSIEVLEKAILLGGTTIRSYTSSLGVTGRFQNDLMVHERLNENCKVCNTPIIKEKVNGRGTYYCPKCQKSKQKKK
jgi:formamidopyrimidine-DNA glycosylase